MVKNTSYTDFKALLIPHNDEKGRKQKQHKKNLIDEVLTANVKKVTDCTDFECYQRITIMLDKYYNLNWDYLEHMKVIDKLRIDRQVILNELNRMTSKTGLHFTSGN